MKKLVATGWQVPTDGDCTTLTTLVGGETNSGGAIKETGTTYWTIHNTVATNSIGFMVLLGGGSFDNGTFILVCNAVAGTSLESAKAFASSNYSNDNNGFVIRYKSIKA